MEQYLRYDVERMPPKGILLYIIRYSGSPAKVGGYLGLPLNCIVFYSSLQP
jgi:hypothetical protein